MAKNADRKKLGWWWVAGMLTMFMSLQAGALDLDHEISRYNESSSQITGTLGRDRGSVKAKTSASRELPSLDEEDLVEDYKVELIPVKRDKS